MYRFDRALMLAAALAVALPAAGHAQHVPGAPTTNWEREHAEYNLKVLRSYNALVVSWRDALVGGDPGRAATEYSAEARLLVSGYPELTGRDSIRAFLDRQRDSLVDIRTSLAEFLASDRLAFASGPLVITWREGSAGGLRTLVGNHVTVLVREGRQWRIRSQVLRYEEPMLSGT
jgi:ketosteroid isomerase-like protein